jgi:adenylate cyclase
MGDKEDRAANRKQRIDRLAKIVTGLTNPEAEGALARARSVAQQLEYDKVVNMLNTSEEVMSAVRELVGRDAGNYTATQAAERAGVTVEEFRKINLAAGFADPEPDAKVFTDEDVATMKIFVDTTGFFGEDVAIQNIRVMGAAMSKVADAFISSFVTAVGRQSQGTDFTQKDLDDANAQAVSLLPGALQAMGVLLRRQILLKSRPEIPVGADWEGVDALDRAIGFCDLVGYTALSQQISTSELAAELRDFETSASDLIIERRGQVVKLIGDEIMFVTPDISTGYDIGLALVERFSRGDVVAPVRVGIAAGRVIVREGDYFGPVVNLAARIVKLAPPSGLLAPASLPSGEAFVYDDVGAPELKGFDDPIPLVSVSRVAG